MEPVWVNVIEAESKSRTLGITVYNNGPRRIFLEGCNPYILEQREADGWVERHVKRCFWEGEAVSVPSMGKRDFDFIPPEHSDFSGRYRVKVRCRYDCEEESQKLPVSEMGCRREVDIYSAEFTIGPR